MTSEREQHLLNLLESTRESLRECCTERDNLREANKQLLAGITGSKKLHAELDQEENARLRSELEAARRRLAELES